MMRLAVLAAEHAARAMARTVACGVAARRLFDLQHQIEGNPEAAAELAVATGTFAEFMAAEVQGEARLGHFKTAEFEPAHAVPFSDRRPAVAAGGRPATRPRLKQMPDEILLRSRVFALDRDPEPAAPSGHRA